MRNRVYMLAAALSLFAAACTQEPLNEVYPEQNGAGTTLEATAEAPSEGTRTVLRDNSVLWSNGDAFSLLAAGGANSKFTLSSGAGRTSGTFTGTLSGNPPYYAIYPYSSGNRLDGDTLRFSLPQTQTYKSSSLQSDLLPLLAKLSSADDGVAFKNIFGLIRISLKGSQQRIFKMAIRDLAGEALWGDGALALDGNEATGSQALRFYSGSNTIFVNFGDNGLLLNNSAKAFYVAVPAGAFKKGFALVFYDKEGNSIGHLSAQNPVNTIERAVVTEMPDATFAADFEYADPARRGYYKDIFIDGGPHLTHRTTLYAADFLSLTSEYINSTIASGDAVNLRSFDKQMLDKLLVGDEEDSNGVLLYPDGSPRFRTYYCNGGNSRKHGEVVGASGRAAIRNFYNNGGSYVGTCAGAFFSSSGYDSFENYTHYLAIFPGHLYHTGMSKTYTGMTFEEGCPLLKYDFIKTYGFHGGYIDSIYHNGGCYMSDVPQGTEVLMRYANCPAGGEKNDGRVSTWAYKASAKTGRVVDTGSHPERETGGDKRALFAAMILYSMEGNGERTLKGRLNNGKTWWCDKTSGEKDPLHTMIGDRQYHHFVLDLPNDATDVSLLLEGRDGYDFSLCMNPNGYAWRGDAPYVLATAGSTKRLSFDFLPAGRYYVSVMLNNGVTATEYIENGTAYCYTYSGDTDTLNGIDYAITASWK